MNIPAKVNREECVSCGTCVEYALKKPSPDEEEIATVDEKTCTECGKCVEACPSEAIELNK